VRAMLPQAPGRKVVITVHRKPEPRPTAWDYLAPAPRVWKEEG
jgi:hypothetical protein